MFIIITFHQSKMNFAVVSFACFALLVGAFAGPGEKIVGGKDANISEFPYQVSIRKEGKGHFCGGSIISKKHILTAAHCVHNIMEAPYTKFTVVTGSTTSSGNNGHVHTIERTDVHEGFLGTKKSAYKNDIAIITLKEPIEFDENQKKIDLPSKDSSLEDKAVVSGWGIEKYPSKIAAVTLKKADMKIIPSNLCSMFLLTPLYKTQVCAVQRKNIGICSGDSGGPLAANNEVIGIASWVVPCGKGFPDVYTKVYAFKDWIKNIIDEE